MTRVVLVLQVQDPAGTQTVAVTETEPTVNLSGTGSVAKTFSLSAKAYAP
jgi:hypothetical protein